MPSKTNKNSKWNNAAAATKYYMCSIRGQFANPEGCSDSNICACCCLLYDIVLYSTVRHISLGAHMFGQSRSTRCNLN